jgi:hypothetical protein
LCGFGDVNRCKSEENVVLCLHWKVLWKLKNFVEIDGGFDFSMSSFRVTSLLMGLVVDGWGSFRAFSSEFGLESDDGSHQNNQVYIYVDMKML